MDVNTTNKTIDLTGIRCPNLLFSVINALGDMETGQTLEIIATAHNAPSNMTTWCRQSDNELIDIYEEYDKFVILIRKGRDPQVLQTQLFSPPTDTRKIHDHTS